MTKTFLLTATALAAIGFAGAANAQTLSFAEVSNQIVKASALAVATPYGIANESILTTIASRRTDTAANANDVRFTTVGSAALERGTTYRVTYALTGTATPTFIAQATAGALTTVYTAPGIVTTEDAVGVAACIGTPSVASGTGAGGSSSVSFIFTVPTSTATCDAADLAIATQFQIDLPFQVVGLGTVTGTVSGALDPSNTNPAALTNRFSATGSSTLMVQGSDGYRIFANPAVDNVSGDGVDNADNPTFLALGSSGAPFRSFASADLVIGGVGFTTAPTTGLVGIYAGLNAVALPAPTYSLTVSPTSGDFSVLKPQTDVDDGAGGEVDFTVATNNLSATAGATVSLTAPQNIKLRIDGTPTTSIATTPQTFTVTVQPVLPAANSTVVTRPAAITNAALETVGLQGTTFVAPWVQSSNASYNTVIRVANNGTTGTGSVQLTLASPLATPTRTVCTSAQLPELAAIPAGGELAINSADLSICFGAFARGDVSVTILSLATNFTAKMRIVSPGGLVSEQSLGRFGSPVAY